MTLTDLQRKFPDKIMPVDPIEAVGERITSAIRPGEPDLIPGLLPKQGQLVIAGETNIGKSLVALEICSALTTGTSLWGNLEPNEKIGKVLYVLGEHYPEVIKRLYQKTNLPMSEEVWLVGPEALGGDKWLVQNGKQNAEGMNRLAQLAKGCDLVVFDPLAAFFIGDGSENDNAGMRVVLDTLGNITQTVGASCLILAHQGKPTMGKDGQEYARTKYAIRGASAVEDAATNIFYMGHLQGGSGAATGVDANRLFTLLNRKYKGEAPDEYRLIRDRDKLTHTILGNRPFIEARKFETQAKMARLQAQFPEMAHKEAIRILSVIEGFHENTIRNYLGATS